MHAVTGLTEMMGDQLTIEAAGSIQASLAAKATENFEEYANNVVKMGFAWGKLTKAMDTPEPYIDKLKDTGLNKALIKEVNSCIIEVFKQQSASARTSYEGVLVHKMPQFKVFVPTAFDATELSCRTRLTSHKEHTSCTRNSQW